MNDQPSLIEMTVDIVSAYVSSHEVPAEKAPALIRTVYETLSELTNGVPSTPVVKAEPAVSIKKSLTADYIICLEDGKRFKSLKRHLRSRYNMSPEEYRTKWGLPSDYPMVAPNYAKARSALAKRMGLGRRREDEEESSSSNGRRK
ncbi:MAG: MucR family transcriptional regulator [Caulobacterales bacterium]